MKKDNIYSKKMQPLPPFSFNEKTSEVFDDMITRSVPCYRETQELITNLVQVFYQEKSNVYDLGCSTGETIVSIKKNLKSKLNIIGVDSSSSMIEKAKEKCAKHQDILFICDDVLNIEYTDASVVVLKYVLQFMLIEDRIKLLKKIRESLLPNAIVVIFEKIISKHFKGEFIQTHELFKEQQGYSQMEIKQKREALEKILVPLTYEDNKTIIQEAGYSKIEKCFQYLNFSGIICSI
jgi:tRNA (cmo5U34)-methyltransferase